MRYLTTFMAMALFSSSWAIALTTEHVDLNIRYAGGPLPSAWTMTIEDDDNLATYGLNQATLFARLLARGPRPSGSSWDFIGVPAGAPYWRLPQLQNNSLLYLGVSAAGVGFTSIGQYNPVTESGGKVNGYGPWVKLTLLSVRSKGKFSVWRSGDAGPIPYMASSDGISANDSLWVLASGHNHYNWGFTLPGNYEVTFKTSAYTRNFDGSAGTLIEGQPQTVRFFVEFPKLTGIGL